MLGFLFRTLTAEPNRASALFDAITAKAREPHWYVEGKVPDTIDGRFSVLATITALVLVRLEQLGDEGNALSVALTERFIEVMEAEHRELGLGDPTLGKTVRKLVGSLGRRVDTWRLTTDWTASTHRSLYKEGVSADALRHSSEALEAFSNKLQLRDVEALVEGKLQ